MFNPDELASFKQNVDAYKASLQKAPVQTKQKKKGNFFTNLLPTGGGIAGGAAGAAIGTALLPGIGTLIGAGLGGALGGGGAKVAENAIEHQNLGSGVAGEAALNGLFGAGPLRLGRAAIDTARGLKAGTGLADAITSAGTNAANMSAKKVIGNKLISSADNMAQRSLKLNGSKFNTDFANRSGEEVGQFARRFNIPKLGVQGAAENVYHPGLQAYGEAVQSLGAIPKSEVLANIKKDASKYLSSAVPDKKAMGTAILDKANGILKNLPDTINAADLNGVKSEIMGLVKPGLTDSAGLTNNDVLHAVGNGIRKTINAVADKSGVSVNPELAKLGFKSTKLGDLGDELHSLGSILDQASVKSRVGGGSSPVGLPNLLGIAAGGASFGGPVGAAGGLLATATINSQLGRRVLAKGALKTGEKLVAKGETSSPFSLGSITKRLAPIGVASGGANYLSSPNSDTTTANPTSTNAPTNVQNIPGLSQNSGDLSSSISSDSPFAPQNLESAIQKILANGGTLDDAAKFASLADTVQKLQAASTPSSKQLNATQLQQANNANSGLADLQTLAQSIQNDPSVLYKDAIPGGSIARRLTGTTSYDAAKQNIVDVIARLRSGAAITEDEAQRYMKLLPGGADTPQSATDKLGRLTSLLSAFANPEAAQPDLTSALLAAQGV